MMVHLRIAAFYIMKDCSLAGQYQLTLLDKHTALVPS